ncbi:type II secretion system pilot lipoprotein GspS-beta [Grimontia sp. S25]|uniref:Type II secretion system pilot lipoprotein GspS-beta n=1 Tax=Grimontia sedimenti TaxID=2711294 RepID=A0A6M1RLY2_9GAMM|nr:type II secretion system pilot lipoprotein GspS-beta [Grimontia sedimenti]NGN97087.1 type II secretion system pilot lipoprotein GspS-beta [Grimontia sedimenti]
MRKTLKTGRIALISAAALVLSACSSTSDLEIAESFAAQRADMLSKLVPIQLNGYNLVRAKSNSTEIELTLLYSGSGDVAPAALAEGLEKTYCTDNEIYSLMEKGVHYKLLFRDARGRPVLERTIRSEDCEKHQ